MSNKNEIETEALARRKRLDQFASDAERAREEYAAESKAIDERTERLRRQRLASEVAPAADRKAGRGSRAAVRRASPKPKGQVRRSSAASELLPGSAKEGVEVTEPHRFQPGQRVTITARAWGAKGARGVYRVVSQLPADQSGNLYRVRSEAEQHDRVVGEAQLSPAAN
jgi:hypothetical protein